LAREDIVLDLAGFHAKRLGGVLKRHIDIAP
jgi:hypothetical protein